MEFKPEGICIACPRMDVWNWQERTPGKASDVYLNCVFDKAVPLKPLRH